MAALVAIVIAIVVLRGLVEILLVAGILLLLVGSYLQRRYSRRRAVHHRPDDRPAEPR